MSGSWIIICPGVTLCGGVMLLGLQSPAGRWVDKSTLGYTSQLLQAASGSRRAEQMCGVCGCTIWSQIWDWLEAPAPCIRCQCVMSATNAQHPPVCSLSLDLAPEKVTRAWHAMLAPGPGPRVPPPDIGSKCRNKCQPRSPSTSDGGKQPRVKWTLIGPLIDTLPRLTLIYLHWFSCLCSNQQQALCYISSCDLKQFCFHNKPCRCVEGIDPILKMSNHLFLERVLVIINPRRMF